MKPAVISAIITGVATVTGALITAWSVRGVRGGSVQRPNEVETPQRSHSQPEDGLVGIQRQVFEPSRERERLRRRIAILLIVSLLVVVVFSFWYVWHALSTASPSGGGATKDTATVIRMFGTTLLTPLAALFGAIVGFYYGAQTKQLERDSDDQE